MYLFISETAFALSVLGDANSVNDLLKVDTIVFRESQNLFSAYGFEEEVPDDIVEIKFIIPNSDEAVGRSIKTEIP